MNTIVINDNTIIDITDMTDGELDSLLGLGGTDAALAQWAAIRAAEKLEENQS